MQIPYKFPADIQNTEKSKFPCNWSHLSQTTPLTCFFVIINLLIIKYPVYCVKLSRVMIPDIKVVAQILKVVTHWTLLKLMGMKPENIFWTWELPASTPAVHVLAIMSLLGQYLCSRWTGARGNVLVKWFIEGMFFLPGTSGWLSLTDTSLTEWLLAKRQVWFT